MSGIAAEPSVRDEPVGGVRHLYVHLPFCAHRCGYCDFVTVVGRRDAHFAYVEALLAELALERPLLADPLETVFLGGGTPTFTAPAALDKLLDALPAAREVTVEANPETVTPALARRLHERGVNRVSVGAQSFAPQLLAVLERHAGPDDVRRAVQTLRDACFDNISLDLVYGIPGQSASDLERDLAEAVALGPEHLSLYELEAKPGTRFTHRHGAELERQVEAMEGYFERVVATLTTAGYRWYETANFCLAPEQAHGRDLRARHNLGYWQGRDYLGVGIGAFSTVAGKRWRNTPSLARYIEALGASRRLPRLIEPLDPATQARERVMLGLRLDEPLTVGDLGCVLDADALARLVGLDLVARSPCAGSAEQIALTSRGRFLGGAVSAELIRWPDEAGEGTAEPVGTLAGAER
jgi:putative oxygen-independent coproporphyrinogen III oxidase